MPAPKQRFRLSHDSVPRYASQAGSIRRALTFAALPLWLASSAPAWEWARVAPHYREEVQRFLDTCGNLCPPLSTVHLVVQDVPLFPPPEIGPIVGSCRIVIEGLRLVRYVSLNSLAFNTPVQRRATLWHELLHCMADDNHTKIGEFDLMDPYDQPTEFYEQNWDALVTATFCRVALQRGIERKGCTP